MFSFVKNGRKYWEFIRNLRNDERIKFSFIQQEYITKEQQTKYMKKHGDNYFICLDDGNPAGFIGQIDGDIRIATHPNFQNKGIGVFMLKEFIRLYPNAVAKVKVDNMPSIRTFQSAGFKIRYYLLEYDA